jgi:hypothetical protein
MKKVRLTVAHNPNNPADDLRVAARVRRDLWAHSPVEVDPDSSVHKTYRDAQQNAYFEFATNYDDEIQRVLRERGYLPRVTMTVVADPVGPECVNCGKSAGLVLPTVCPNCGFRDMSPCPHCNQEVARQAYLPLGGDHFRCPLCHRAVRLRLRDPLFDANGDNPPLIMAEKAEG